MKYFHTAASQVINFKSHILMRFFGGGLALPVLPHKALEGECASPGILL